MKKGILFLFVVQLLASLTLVAQNPYVQHFTTAEGLPSNNVYKIIQDSKKFIWVTTDEGVARYDGNLFTYFRKQDGLSSNDVFNIKEDSIGRIWFFHINASLNFFYNNTIHNEKNTPFLDSLKTTSFFRDFFEDENHTLYFYYNSQLLIYSLNNQDRVERYKIPSLRVPHDLGTDSIEAMDFRYMNRNSKGEFMFWTPAGFLTSNNLFEKPRLVSNASMFKDVLVSSSNKKYILRRSINQPKFTIAKFQNETILEGNEALPETGSKLISSILEDSNGILWISTYDKGVFCYRGNSLIYHFNIKDAKNVLEDNEKNIWISSLKEGVYKISQFFHKHKHYGVSSFENNGIYALSENSELGIWCTNGKNIYLVRNEELYKLDFQHDENSFDQILQVGPGTLLVGETSKQPYALEGIRINFVKKRIDFDRVSQSRVIMKKIRFNPPTNRIVSYNQYLLYLFDPTRLFDKIDIARSGERVNFTYFNSGNEMIINAKHNYIFKSGVPAPYSELACFNGKIIADFLRLDNQSELFNIEGDSLFVMHDKQLFNLSAAFNQPIDFQIKNLAYFDSTLIISTSRSIYVCENPLKVFNKKPVSLHPVNINFRSIHDIHYYDKKLYVASDDGLTTMSHEDLHYENNCTPIPYFRSIQVNDGENQVSESHVTLISSQRIDISFNCINYSQSPTLFSYKLKGSDEEWTVLQGKNVVLQNLANGKYTFQLRVRKPTSQWSEPIKVHITVKATIWQHPLFYFLILLILAGIVFLLVLRQKNIELDRRQLEHQILLLEQKALQAMMNPHFIFNSLGSIQNYLLHNRPYEAGTYLSQFARLIRQNLNAIDTSMINLEEEVDRIKNYLNLERLRLEDKFEYTIEIDDSIESEDILIPSMIIQPFVENAIWHGIANLEDKGTISISFSLKNIKSLLIVIRDSGIGISRAEKYSSRKDDHLNRGMNITRKRLHLLSIKYDIGTGIEVSEIHPEAPYPGTQIEIIVPFLYGKTEFPS